MVEREILAGLISQRMSVREIAIELQCSPTNARYWLKAHDLATNPRRGAKSGRLAKRARRCEQCNETDPSKFYGRLTRICRHCKNQENIRRGNAMRVRVRDHLGGKCAHCGFTKYSSALSVHHLDPSNKDMDFNTSRYWSWGRMVRELAGCVLLCANCHSGIHNGEWFWVDDLRDVA